MANVQIIQRHAHLAGAVRLEFVNGREGKIAKAVLTAISNSRRGSGDAREDEATAIQWTLWGKQAENAAEYLGKGSHVNIVGRLRNNNFEKEGQTVYGMAFTAEEIDYLESRAESDARRHRDDDGNDQGDSEGATTGRSGRSGGNGGKGGNGSHGSIDQAAPATASRRPRQARQPVNANANANAIAHA